MAAYVIDAPTLVHLVDAGLRLHPEVRLVAPGSLRSDALGLLLEDVVAGRRADAEALDAHERMTAVKVRLLGDRVSRAVAWRIAREHGWSTLRDAEHLALVRLQADALVTVDDALAAKAAGVVPVAPLEVLVTG